MDLDINNDICLFQGTFDPIHNAHLRVALYVVNNNISQHVVFIPAKNPPHKDSKAKNSLHRLQMVKLATIIDKRFQTSDIEYKRDGLSYTYLTICELKEKYNIKKRIKFIIGTDAFEKIETWYQADKLKELLEFIVFTRDNNFDPTNYDYLKNKGYKFSFQNLEYLDISSTQLRELIRTNKDFSAYVPESVKEYIIKNELYR